MPSTILCSCLCLVDWLNHWKILYAQNLGKLVGSVIIMTYDEHNIGTCGDIGENPDVDFRHFDRSQTDVAQHYVDLSSPLKIAGLSSRNRVFLAPMSGISDVPFRKLAWKFGAGLVFSEMVASEALVKGQARMAMKAQGAGLPLHAVQIAGRQSKWMALGAKMARDCGADLIDINMGCPARRVTNGLSGSALMRDLDHAMGLVEAVVDAVEIPVTLKMRLGWDENSINAPSLAARAQSAGIAMISVHGRTRCQFYKGSADWKAVNRVRQATRLPLVVNGDIIDANSARRALDQSQADAVMVGRASYGAPWLAGCIADDERVVPDHHGELDLVLEHFEEVLIHYGVDSGVRQFRKHLGWYLDRLAVGSKLPQIRSMVLTSVDPGEIQRMIRDIYQMKMQMKINVVAP